MSAQCATSSSYSLIPTPAGSERHLGQPATDRRFGARVSRRRRCRYRARGQRVQARI